MLGDLVTEMLTRDECCLGDGNDQNNQEVVFFPPLDFPEVDLCGGWGRARLLFSLFRGFSFSFYYYYIIISIVFIFSCF